MGIVIKFDPPDVHLITYYADARGASKRAFSIDSSKIDKNQTQFEVDYHGMMGEFAVTKWLGIDFDRDINLTGDGQVADVVVNGKTIQIKTTTFTGLDRCLIFNDLEDVRADIIVLCGIKSATSVELIGYTDLAGFENNFIIKNFGYGQRVCLSEDLLYSINTLKEILGG